MKNEIVKALTWYANQVAQVATYKKWDDDFCRNHVKGVTKMLTDSLKHHIDWNNLTVEEAEELRLQRWDEDSDLYLIPLYLVQAIPNGVELTSVSGEKVVYEGDNIDLDIRFGCIAYGVEVKAVE